MATTAKSSKDVSTKVFEFTDTFVPLYEKGMEHLADLQKKSLDIAARQNSEWTGAVKKAFHFAPEGLAAFWIDTAARTFDKYVDIQKEIIEHVVEQSHAVTKFNREHREAEVKQA
ncbi:MAG TPA: hypothetical protein VMI06_12065 [Terriglobia bacterium]|nr:hypothetical protein [Terriglobia bacterium]